MRFYSWETMRIHMADLTNEHDKFKLIDEKLRNFIVNRNNKTAKTSGPMHDLVAHIGRKWPEIGLLDYHDLVQEAYFALVKAYSRVNWETIENSTNPDASLWAFLKKSVKLDIRIAINSFKDGMRVPRNNIWANNKKGKFEQDNFFSTPVDQAWFFINDELLSLYDNSSTTLWETEQLHEHLQDVMRKYLTDTERLILEMSYGIDQPEDKPRTGKYIGNYFNMTPGNVRVIKLRALKKLKNEEAENYLKIFIEN